MSAHASYPVENCDTYNRGGVVRGVNFNREGAALRG